MYMSHVDSNMYSAIFVIPSESKKHLKDWHAYCYCQPCAVVCWVAKVTTPSKSRNQFYLGATSSPWNNVLSTVHYVFDSTIDVLTIFLKITCENSQIVYLAFGKWYDDFNTGYIYKSTQVCRKWCSIKSHFIQDSKHMVIEHTFIAHFPSKRGSCHLVWK